MHKCIEARDIYIYSPTDRLRSNGTSSFRTFSIRTTPIATFYYPSHSSARNRTFKAALYTGCAVKKRRNAQTFGIESRRPRLREKKFVFVSWRTNERTAVFVETNEIFYYRREKGWPRGGARTAAQIARTISNAALPFEF